MLKRLDPTECEDNIKLSLVVIMDRLNMQFKDINETILDISTEFNYMSLKQIREALRNGSLGKYGRTYKLSTQEVCFWIREYLKANKNKLGL
jgi:predicted RNA binding protein with dsRBD fold (UPF0201 family)